MTLTGSKPIFRNIEGFQSLNVYMPDFRRPGLSAMIRVKDEAEYLRRSLDSIVDWMDEIVICIQGEQSDDTHLIAYDYAVEHPAKVKVYLYPFDSLPNGPGHGGQPKDSVYERAYFYNWCLAKTNHEYVCKWDGDMVALDGLGDVVRENLGGFDVIYLTGAEMVSETHQSVKPYTATDPRIFRVCDHTYYVTGPMCEQFHEEYHPIKPKFIKGHQFKHFKWAKSERSITKAWPDNWREIPHFQELMARKQEGQRYAGPQ